MVPSQIVGPDLFELQPRLSDLEAEVQVDAFVDPSVNDRIRLLVGPTAPHAPEPILRTITARNITERHLGQVYKNSRRSAAS